jgi:hypothetical protein
MKRLFIILIFALSILTENPASSQEVRSSLTSDLTKTYGYYIGQKLSVEKIQNELPTLSARALQAQLEFDLEFKGSYENIEKELQKLFHDRWTKYKSQLRSKFTSNLGSTSISKAQADAFIRTIRLRAKGQISPPILETLLSYNPKFQISPVKELMRGFKNTYRTKGHPKAKGVDFQIDYPRSWRAKEGRRPNVIQLMTSKNGRGLESIILMVKKLPLPSGYKITDQELDELFSQQGLREMLPKGANFISTQPIIMDNHKGGMMVFDQSLQRIDQKIFFRSLHFITLYEKKMIFIQCMVGSQKADQRELTKRFRRLEPLFKLVANSFIIQSQY